ncbi:hypothetical protein B0H16DRAFT_1891922 [Mycena metata]|uniref:Uncharacterized protein n=1 Tax=Mycena metata TaxID=1033252 RepID=A0AAD7I6W4_9AGAR|nr:hypothetical protein B0H16DRAFT_1891922 [Mycena metata]
MSLLIDGVPTTNIGRSSGSLTQISAAFLRSALPHRNPNSLFAITLRTEDTPFTVLLACQVSSRIGPDIVLALDWKASVRECMLGFGLNVPTSFDPATLLVSEVHDVGASAPGVTLPLNPSLNRVMSVSVLNPVINPFRYTFNPPP